MSRPDSAPAAVPPRELAGRPLALRNWQVRYRIVALVLLPLAMGMAFAGLRISSEASDAVIFGRVQRLAVLGQQVTGLADALQQECDTTITYITGNRTPADLAVLDDSYHRTDEWAAQARLIASGLEQTYPAVTRRDLARAQTRIADLRYLREFAVGRAAPALAVVSAYSQTTADLFALDDDIAQEGSDATLMASVRALGSVSQIKDEAAQRLSILHAALVQGRLAPGQLDAVTAAQAEQASDLTEFRTWATLGEQEAYDNTVAGAQVDQARELEQQAVAAGLNGGPLDPSSAAVWDQNMTYMISQMRREEVGLARTIVNEADVLHRNAGQSAELTAVMAILVLLGVVAIALVVAGSMVRPLRRLHAGALKVATVRLPAEVGHLSQLSQAGEDLPELAVEPIGVHSADEIGRVARAFDQVHQEAVRLAADEARLRGSVSAMVVSLSRRTQSILERLLRLIDAMELAEDDPERLASLFRMDHLATRMRRHSENMLVLAGHESPRRTSEPVPLVDVIRASISEVEQYDRVTINVQPGITLVGSAGADFVHLLAELIENATTYSARTTQVEVAAYALNSGGVLVSITDSGMGMTPEQLEHMNWRLEHPPAADVTVSRHMGLFAVSHLAARHGFRVRLQAAFAGGLTAQVWLPDTLTKQRSDRMPHPADLQPALADIPAGPPAAAFATGSDWFRASGWKLPSAGEVTAGPATPRPGEPAAGGSRKASSVHEGWSAASGVLEPFVGGVTQTGLPIRIPGANLVPGSAGGAEARAARKAGLAVSAEEARSKLARFQRGGRRARDAAGRATGPGREAGEPAAPAGEAADPDPGFSARPAGRKLGRGRAA